MESFAIINGRFALAGFREQDRTQVIHVPRIGVEIHIGLESGIRLEILALVEDTSSLFEWLG